MTTTDEIDGKPITAHGGALRKAGDGLSDALKLEDRQLRIGDPVTLLVKGVVAPPSFKADKNNATGIMRVDNINVSSALVIDDAEVEDRVTEHEAAVAEMKAREKEAKDGIQRIAFDDTDEDDEQAAEDGQGPADLRALPDVGEQ